MASDLEKAEFGFVSSVTWWHILLAVNAILGIVLLEWAWKKTARHRNPIDELNCQFPELRRYDAADWKKWKFYPGAMTLLIPRILSFAFWGIALAVFINIFMIGHDRSQPLSGIRKYIVKYWLKLCTHCIFIFTCFNIATSSDMTLEDVDNYEEYLGPVDEQRRYH